MSERRNGDWPSYPLPLWNGILEHYARMGAAIWAFIWCIDRITSESDGVGLVAGGSPVKVNDVAATLKADAHTARRQLDHLQEQGYITRERAPHGYVIRVLNSHKWGIWSKRSAKNSGSDGPQVDDDSQRDRPKPPSDRPKTPKSSSINGLCIKEDTANNTAETQQEQNPPASPVREARDLAYAVFKERFGQEPSWLKGDYVALADLFKRKRDLTVAELERRLRFYFDSTELFIVKQGRSLTYLCSKFDSFIDGPLHTGNGNQKGVNRAEQRDLQNLRATGLQGN